MKKRNGVVKELMLLFIMTFAFCIIITSFLDIGAVIVKNGDIQQLGRSYILEMETEGYMTASMRTSLQQELRDMGVTDIDMSGTSLSEVGYGNWIYLDFTCVVPFEQLNLDAEFMNAFREEKEWTFHVYKKSTAKN